MEIKRIKDYSDDELKELLFFWFKYYMKKMYSLDDLEKFNSMVEEKPRVMFNMAVMLYIKGLGPTIVLDAIRGNMEPIEKILTEMKTVRKEVMAEYTRNFIKEVTSSYNNPKPTVPQSESDIISQILEMIGAKPSEVNIVNVGSPNSISINDLMSIISDVAFKESEIIDGMPNKNFVTVQGLQNNFAYVAERLERHIDEINEMVDKLPPFTRERSFNELAKTKDGATWAFTKEHVEALMTLAIACNILKVSCIKDGIPYFVRTNKKVHKIKGQKPSEFPCYRVFCQKKVKKELSTGELIEYALNNMTDESKKYLELIGYKLVLDDGMVYFCRLSDESLHESAIEIDYKGIKFTTEVDGKKLKYSVIGDKLIEDRDILLSEYVSFDTLGDEEELNGEFFEVGLGNDEKNPDKVYSMNILYANTNLEQKIYKYLASKDQISVIIESDLPRDGEESLTTRTLYYTDPVSDKICPCCLHINEVLDETESYQINVDRTSETSFTHELNCLSNRDKSKNGKSSEIVKSNKSAQELSLEYLKTSRIKNLYNRVIEVLEDSIPGVKELINENHPFTAYIEEVMKQSPNTLYEDLMNKCGIKEANLPNEGNNGPKKRRNVK